MIQRDEITVNANGIQLAIAGLQSVKNSCETEEGAAFELDGEGETATQLKELLALYREFAGQLSALVTSSISNLQAVQSSMEAADAAAAALQQKETEQDYFN